MKFLKGNQVIIYIIALMLVTAGYLNYTTKNEDATAQTNAELNTVQLGDIGDAALVSSNDVVTESTASDVTNQNVTNTTNTTNTTETSATTNSANTTTTQTNTSPNDYFANSKLERDKMYSQMIEVYQNVLNSSSSQEAQKQSATEEIQKINNIKNSIMICENLIKTKGFEDSLVFVNGDSINVIIGATTLEKEQVSEIQNLIQREMKAEAKNIHIAMR